MPDSEPIDLKAALRAARERVWHAFERKCADCSMGLPCQHITFAFDQYEALARAVGAADNCGCSSRHLSKGLHIRCPHEKHAERLAREVLMHSEQEREHV